MSERLKLNTTAYERDRAWREMQRQGSINSVTARLVLDVELLIKNQEEECWCCDGTGKVVVDRS